MVMTVVHGGVNYSTGIMSGNVAYHTEPQVRRHGVGALSVTREIVQFEGLLGSAAPWGLWASLWQVVNRK